LCTDVTVKNYAGWCSVSAGTAAANSFDTQTVCVLPGILVLSASPLVGFQLGNVPWHGTANDVGSRANRAASTTVVVARGATCVWVCCELSGGGGCPTTDQCP
jgi:hypothetical protein